MIRQDDWTFLLGLCVCFIGLAMFCMIYLFLNKFFSYSNPIQLFRNLWNFSPKHFFTDSSGSFWRERRLTDGLYTDGNLVYEQKYRYSDGKNGMKPISKLDALLKSKSIRNDVKSDLLKRLEKDAPDVVIED